MKNFILSSVESLKSTNSFEQFAAKGHEIIDGIEIFLQKINRNASQEQLIHESAFVHETALVEQGSIIDEEAYIGPNCYVKAFSYVGKGCKLGCCVEVSAAILLDNTKIAHKACITNSVIGRNCNLGYGFVTASRNLVSDNIKIQFDKNRIIYSDKKHHGSVVGDYVETGVMVSVMPGASIGNNSILFPNSCISGFLPENSKGFYLPKWMQ